MRLTERLARCFDGANEDQVHEYLSILRDAWRDISTGLARNAWITALLVTVFELSAHGVLSTITLGPFALKNINYIRIFIPSAVGYLFYEQVLMTVRWIETEEVHRYLMNLLYRKIELYDFDAFLAPRLPSLTNLVHSYSENSAAPSKHLRAAAQYGLALIFLLVIPIFEVFALKELSGEFTTGGILFWINAVISGALVILALAVFVCWLVEERLVWNRDPI